MKRRLLASILSLVMVMSLLPTAVLADDEGNVSPTSGYCGGDTEAESYSYFWQGVSSEHATQTVYKNIAWELVSNGSNDTGTTYKLVLTGEGPMFDFTQKWQTVGAETDEPWWNWRSQITEVEIAEGITTIGKLGFYALALESITIPDSVTSIGESAVADNKHLESVVIGAGVSTITGSAFTRDSALKTLTFKDGADVVIEQDAFYDSAIENLTIPSRVREIDYRAFGENRGKNNENPTFLKAVTFEENTSLTLKGAIFEGCASLTDADMSSLDCDSSQMGAVFSECTALENVKLPTSSNFTKLPGKMFSGCTSLKTVVIPANITAWGSQVFNRSGVHTLVFETTNMAAESECGENFVANDKANKVIIYTQKAEDAGFQKTGQGKSGLYGKDKQINAVTNGGTFPADTVFTEGVLATPVRGNYTFDGWYSDSAFTESKKLTDSAAPAVDKTYYAKWVSTIAFDANGGKLPTDTTNPMVVTEGSAIGTLPTPTRTDYTFVGWNTAADGFGKFVTESEIPTGDMTLYAVWGTAAGSGYTILPIEDQTYTGQPLTPTVYMVDASKNRIAAAGVSYENNTNAGTATAKVTLDGTEYAVTFTIVPKQITAPAADQTVYTYNDTEQTYQLAENDAYTITGSTQTNANETGYEVKVELKDKANTKWAGEGDDTADKTYTFIIKKATVTVTASNKSAYVNGTAPALTDPVLDTDYTVSGLFGNDTLTTEPTLKYVDANGTEITPDMTKTGDTIIRASGAAAGDNYTVDYADGKLTVSSRPSSGGGGSSPSYTVAAPAKTDNGAVSTNVKSAKQGDTVTVTVTPDKGYVLETLTVLDKNGKEIKLTDKGDGKYTFTMPAGKVEVKATFMDDNTMLNHFVDVQAGDYFYDAVLWAVKNGITNGVSDTAFGPDLACTRAQIVTFLWRAAGSPEPKNAGSFADVSADSYYAKAVAWAVENGITGGTGDGQFSPDATCTREQAVAFLYRASGSPAVSGGSAFSDVAEDAYYANAVAWAEKNGVTGGIGGGLFGSGNDCTRAQIVTFLYRTYQEK